MKRIFFLSMTLIMASFFIACDPAANTGNKPANAPANNANTAAPVNTATIEADIKKLMDTAQAALGKNDADAMDKIYGENYMLVNLDGSVQTRAERLASLRSGDAKYDSFAYSDANIRINAEGTGAVVIVKLAMKGTFRGKRNDGDFRVTQVYSKTKDGWKQVTAQATKIEGAAAPAKTNDKAKADDKSKDEAPKTSSNAPANK